MNPLGIYCEENTEEEVLVILIRPELVLTLVNVTFLVRNLHIELVNRLLSISSILCRRLGLFLLLLGFRVVVLDEFN